MITLEKTNLYNFTSISGEAIKAGQGTGGQFKPNLSLGCFKGLGAVAFLPQLSGTFDPEIQGESLVVKHPTFEFTFKSTGVLPSFNEFGGVDLFLRLPKKPP